MSGAHSPPWSAPRPPIPYCPPSLQAELKVRASSERSALTSLVRRTLDEELGGLMRAGLEPRVAALEEAQGQARAQIEVHAQVRRGGGMKEYSMMG